jgi:hypothetical protein
MIAPTTLFSATRYTLEQIERLVNAGKLEAGL